MIICIIAGGEGTRLWPLSQPHRPKHLLPLVDEKSLLQNTFARATALTDTVFVVSEVSHAAEVAQQLPELPNNHLIIEPARRGTASCIVLALARLKKMGLDDQTVCFVAADHHIVDAEGYLETVRVATVASETEQKITLIGIEPTYPATGFGYIELAKRLRDNVYTVASFHEKPNETRAELYFNSKKYLWNISLFVAPHEVFLQSMKAAAPNLLQAYQMLVAASTEQESEQYLELENEPIDTALIEKTHETLVVAGSFGWADLGSFGDLYDVMRDGEENIQKGEIVEMLDCTNSMVLGQSDRPIVAIGLKDVVIVDSPDGLLVVDASQAQRVKEALKNIKDKRAGQ